MSEQIETSNGKTIHTARKACLLSSLIISHVIVAYAPWLSTTRLTQHAATGTISARVNSFETRRFLCIL